MRTREGGKYTSSGRQRVKSRAWHAENINRDRYLPFTAFFPPETERKKRENKQARSSASYFSFFFFCFIVPRSESKREVGCRGTRSKEEEFKDRKIEREPDRTDQGYHHHPPPKKRVSSSFFKIFFLLFLKRGKKGFFFLSLAGRLRTFMLV